jgi:hypothetical protein
MPIRRLALTAALVLLGAATPLSATAASESRLRIAITPVLVEHYLEVNRQLIAYVGEKVRLGPAPLVQGN